MRSVKRTTFISHIQWVSNRICPLWEAQLKDQTSTRPMKALWFFILTKTRQETVKGKSYAHSVITSHSKVKTIFVWILIVSYIKKVKTMTTIL